MLKAILFGALISIFLMFWHAYISHFVSHHCVHVCWIHSLCYGRFWCVRVWTQHTHTHNGTVCSIERSRCWFQYSSLFGGRNIVNLNGFQCVPHADMMGRPRHQPTVSTNGKGGIDRGFCSFITRPLCDHVRSISLPIFSYRHQYHVLDPMVFSVYHVHWLK